MDLKELMQSLSFFELAGLGMSGNGSGEIDTESQPKVLNAVNAALTQLFSTYVIRQDELMLILHPHITYYHLVEKFAESNTDSTEPIRYIQDTAREPFLGRVCRVLQVTNVHGVDLPINDEHNPLSVHTPGGNDVLQVPSPMVRDKLLCVTYQALHRKLTLDDDRQLDVPEHLMRAVKLFTAYQLWDGLSTTEAAAKAAQFFTLYQDACATLVDRGLLDEGQSGRANQFHQKGWV